MVLRLLCLILATLSGIGSLVLTILVIGHPTLSLGLTLLGVLTVFALSIWGFRNSRPVGLASPEARKARYEFVELINRAHAKMSWALCFVLVAVYFILFWLRKIDLDPSVSQLYKVGGGYGESAAHGEPWRLLTQVFLHGSLGHLFSNCLGLWAAGRYLDYLIGPKGLLGIFLIGGIGGSIISSLIHPQTVSVGASGAIFAIYGALVGGLVFSHRLKNLKATRSLFVGSAFQAGAALIYGLGHNGIDNSAHLGGLCCGFLIIGFWYLDKNNSNFRAAVFGSATTLAVLVGLLALPHLIPRAKLDPLVRFEIRDKIVAAISKVEELELNLKLRAPDLRKDPQTMTWIRDIFLPQYRIAVNQLRELRDPSADAKLREIQDLMAQSSHQCLSYFDWISETDRHPAADIFFSDVGVKARQSCEQALTARESQLKKIVQK